MSDTPHVADAEEDFYIIAITPDMCKVGKKTVAYEPSQKLVNEKSQYSKKVFARDVPTLMVGSVVQGLLGNAGKGVHSGVSGKQGHSQILKNDRTVWIEDRQVAAHTDLAIMNGPAS